MKYRFLSIFILLVIFSTNVVLAQKQNANIPKEYAKMKELKQLEPTFAIKAGETFFVRQPIHASVGIDAIYDVKDNTILKPINQKDVFNRPQEEGMTGGDDAVRYWTFKTLKAGKTKIIFEDLYRGESKEKREVEITVK